MKIILLKDHEKLGSRGAVLDVADGYARNFLIPRKIADKATAGTIRAYEHDSAARIRKEDRRLVELEKQLGQLEGLSISFSRNATEDDKLYGAVGVSDIVEALAEKGFALEKKHIVLDEPIKILGVFPVIIRLRPGKEASLKVWVVKASEENQ